MFNELNASRYGYSDIFYKTELEVVLSKIFICYQYIVKEKILLINNENAIRDYILYNYLKKQAFKQKHDLTCYLFDSELPENKGRVDIRVMPINPFISDEAYYIIECKRLNKKNSTGTTGLNAEYISEGICRFVSEKYSCFFKVNAMIGFIVESMDVRKNVEAINKLLTEKFSSANTTTTLCKRHLAEDIDFYYSSTHTCSSGEITIYHLMFDLSHNIT